MDQKIEKIRQFFDDLEANKNGYYDYQACKRCKGKGCCQHFPCFYAPWDFIVLSHDKYTHEERLIILTELLKQGKISIDMIWLADQEFGPLNPESKEPDLEKISNEDGCLFLRARAKDHPIIDFQYFLEEGHNFPCINWDPDKGCQYSEEERPYGGCMLKPFLAVVNGENRIYCHDMVDYEKFVEAWGKHQRLLYDLYLVFKEM